MDVASILIVSSAVAMNAAISVADVIPAEFVLANSAAVGVPRSWLVRLALLKGAGAVGLLIGALWWPPLGCAAAAGLTAFYLGAIVAHLRAGVVHNLAFPATFLGFAVASFVVLSIG